MQSDLLTSLQNFTESGLFGSLPKVIGSFGAKFAKNYILYQPEASSHIEFHNEESEMAPYHIEKLRMRTSDRIPIFGRVYSPPDSSAHTPIVIYFMANAESTAAIKHYMLDYLKN